jgi:hypothetical protein
MPPINRRDLLKGVAGSGLAAALGRNLFERFRG